MIIRDNESSLYEILVPKFKNDDNGNISQHEIKFHNEWDNLILDKVGGLTISKPNKGYFRSWDSDKKFIEEMIPVRIICTEEQFQEILQLTLEHYSDQEAILGYKISSEFYLNMRENEN